MAIAWRVAEESATSVVGQLRLRDNCRRALDSRRLTAEEESGGCVERERSRREARCVFYMLRGRMLQAERVREINM